MARANRHHLCVEQISKCRDRRDCREPKSGRKSQRAGATHPTQTNPTRYTSATHEKQPSQPQGAVQGLAGQVADGQTAGGHEGNTQSSEDMWDRAQTAAGQEGVERVEPQREGTPQCRAGVSSRRRNARKKNAARRGEQVA